ncbi:MAG TPA: hypothetical protein VHO29_07090 [Marmoricola sp.]|nr:hypothetical protein [Marmoricola sp.]
MIAVRRVVVAFVASLATLLLAAPVAAVAPPSVRSIEDLFDAITGPAPRRYR